MSFISKDIAEKEVNQWLTNIYVTEDQKKDFKVNVGIITEGVMNGNLIIDPNTNNVTQKLRVAFGKEEKISELIFKTDLRINEIESFKKTIDIDIESRNNIASVCASTGNPSSVIMQMNAKDFNLSLALVQFFLV